MKQTKKTATSLFFLCSYPKSGRTWLRFILANYLNQIFNLNLTLDFWTLFTLLPNGGSHPQKGLPAYKFAHKTDIPVIISSHGLWQDKFNKGNIIFLLRSPVDVLISYYYHLSYGMGVYDKNIQHFIRDPQAGIAHLIAYLNQWSHHLDLNQTHILSYEQMQSNTQKTVTEIIKFIGLPVENQALNDAIEAASFEKMRALETAKGAPWLCVNSDNPAALRTRQGKVGNHDKYLEEEDIIYIQQQCELKFTDATKNLFAQV